MLVIEVEGKVVGWGSLSSYNTRKGWSGTVEDSVFLHHAYHGKGLGKLILSEFKNSASVRSSA